MKKKILLLPLIILIGSVSSAVQCQTSGAAPPGDVLHPGHLGRTTGDLERIIHFYHDLLGLGLRGKRDEPRPFWTSPGLIAFAASPKNAEFRAVIMPIPGTAAPGADTEMAIEAIEFRNIDRHQYVFNIQDVGASHLVLAVRDLDKVMGRLTADGVPVITSGGKPLELQFGTTARGRAIIVRDPDGYPVELEESVSPDQNTGPTDNNILGASVCITVQDLNATLRLYKGLIGLPQNKAANMRFKKDAALNKLWNTPGAEYRAGGFMVPGSPVMLRFYQYRNIRQRTIKPKLQDIDVAHFLFMVKDMNVIMPRIRAAGLKLLAKSGKPEFIAPKVRALFVTDPNHFFIEFMQRMPETK